MGPCQTQDIPKKLSLAIMSRYVRTKLPEPRREVSDEVPKKRRAQNRAAQKAFRERQKRTYRDLEARNEELTTYLEEALQEINRLRSLVDSRSLEMKTHGDGTSTVQETTEPSVCSAKCHSRVLPARAISNPCQRQAGKRKNTTDFEHLLNAPHDHLHTNACLFQNTTTLTSDQPAVQFSSSSNEAVATMQSAKQICMASANPPPYSIPNHESLHRHCQARQAHQGCTGESAPWLQVDATLAADQADAFAGFESPSSSSLRDMENSCANLMHCSSFLPQTLGYDCCNTGSSNFTSTPARDDDTLDTPLTSPDSTGDMLRFCTDAAQFHSHFTNANEFPPRFSAHFEAEPADFSNLTIPSCFGLGEVDWFDAPY